jgi:chitinase
MTGERRSETPPGGHSCLADAHYIAPFSIDQTVTVKARAHLAGGLWSGTRTAEFEIHFAAPIFVPSSGGPYSKPTTVTITPCTHGSAIYYTTDSSEPTTASILYTVAFSVDQTTTVEACELINGHVWSATKTVLYKIAYAAPTLTPSSGTYAAGKTVTITHTVSGAQIYYTVNGAEPTTSSALYSSPVALSVAGPVALRARALVHGHVWGATKIGTYTITGGTSVSFAALVGRLR